MFVGTAIGRPRITEQSWIEGKGERVKEGKGERGKGRKSDREKEGKKGTALLLSLLLVIYSSGPT